MISRGHIEKKTSMVNEMQDGEPRRATEGGQKHATEISLRSREKTWSKKNYPSPRLSGRTENSGIKKGDIYIYQANSRSRAEE